MIISKYFEGVRGPLTPAYPSRECTAVRQPKPRRAGRRSWRAPETHAKSKTDSRYGDFRPPQGPLLFGSAYAATYIRVAFLEVPATTFFCQKFKMTQGTVGFAARDDASKWRPESASLGTAPISRRRIFLQKNVKSMVFHH